MSEDRDIRRHFLPWDRPLLPQAVEFLAAGWDGAVPLDLTRCVVIVPTRQSGRRLREALAAYAAKRCQAVFPPRVFTPDGFLSRDLDQSVATRLESLLAWLEVLRSLELSQFRAVFPVEPPERSFPWALGLAQQLVRLQVQVAEAGWRLVDVSAKAGEEFLESDRWHQLGELERRHADCLRARGLRDAPAFRIAAAQSPHELAGAERLVVLATPDPMPLAIATLEAISASVPVEVVVYAPPSEASAFDGWGRPRTEAWERREVILPDFSRRVHLAADPAEEAAMVAAAAARYDSPEGVLAVAVADPEVLPLLGGELARAGVAAFHPEGRSRRGSQFAQLLSALAGLVRSPGWLEVAALARCPDFLAFLAARIGSEFSAVRWLAALDEVRARHLPGDLAAALAFSGDHQPGLRVMDALRDSLRRGAFPGNVVAGLAEIFAARRLTTGQPDDASLAEAASAWTEILRRCADVRRSGGQLAETDWWALALQMFGEESFVEEKPLGALELQGWLELLFEDAPHLIVAGLNDGLVPEAMAGDAFLPESLRARLGLKTNATRLARDAYLLTAVAAGRARLDLVFAKTSTRGEPLRPSRLLLQCVDADLPGRVNFLFREAPAGRPTAPWTRAWRLKPRWDQVVTNVSVTALRAWLDCPFRFYLRHGLGLESVDPSKEELDARDFGTLVHSALEAIGREGEWRDCVEVGRLREFLSDELDRQVRRRFGADLTLPLLIQLDSARQRLSKAAELEAAERAVGWRTVEVERKFSLELAGITVTGRIDRIDRHTATGAVRVLDYKTSESPVDPFRAHARRLRSEETAPAWAVFELEGETHVWEDLQLPLYELALAADYGSAITCGYFNLPKALGDSGVSPWEPWTPEIKAAAHRCAAGVCAEIRAGNFWPPRELVGREAERDEFAALFHQGAVASVDLSGKGAKA